MSCSRKSIIPMSADGQAGSMFNSFFPNCQREIIFLVDNTLGAAGKAQYFFTETILSDCEGIWGWPEMGRNISPPFLAWIIIFRS
jgi:hypothetical protein